MATIISKRVLEPGEYEGWLSRFAQAVEARRAAGCRGLRRLKSADDANTVFVVFDWDSHENARSFIEANQKAMQARNPNAPPADIQTWYLEEIDTLPG